MITGNLQQLAAATAVPAKIMVFIEQVKAHLANSQANGRFQLVDDEAFFFIVDDNTQLLAQRRSEMHEKYIDVQIILAGEECFGYSEQPFLSLDEDLLAEKDIAFSNAVVDEQFINLGVDDFIIFTTGQPHRPLIAVNQPAPVRKCIIKIAHTLVD